jgi:hypothetical protein
MPGWPALPYRADQQDLSIYPKLQPPRFTMLAAIYIIRVDDLMAYSKMPSKYNRI